MLHLVTASGRLNLIIWYFDGQAGTFGAKAEVLEPAEARDMIRRNAKETLQLYTEG
jgi:predicted DNA-binding transcriptional regulator YafY